jgi:hypothetical protein
LRTTSERRFLASCNCHFFIVLEKATVWTG